MYHPDMLRSVAAQRHERLMDDATRRRQRRESPRATGRFHRGRR